MIKVIAFDFVGVLVHEKDINLSEEESKLERLFGDNLYDSDYMVEARKVIDNDAIIMRTTEDLIAKLYEVVDKDIFTKVKNKNPNIRLIIATNHVSYIRNFVGDSFDISCLDDLIISSEIHSIKPNKEYYQILIDKYNIKPEELLLLDDNIKNINSAKEFGFKTIHVTGNNIFDILQKYI